MMRRIFAENSKRDIFLGSNKQISIISDIDALVQKAKSVLEIQFGEAIYASQSGMPTGATVWNGTPNLQQFEFFARKQILSVDGITDIIDFNATIDGYSLNFVVSISTVYGGGQFSGNL